MAPSSPPPLPHLTAPRVVFFGMTGRFSSLVLAALLATDIDVAAVVVPALPTAGAPPVTALAPRGALRRSLPLLGQDHEPTVVEQARQRGIPALAVAVMDDPLTVTVIGGYHPDLLGVACFPHRLPPRLLACARCGGLNVHPSLLPRGRGPAPRFWAFRHGLTRSGVTVHVMTSALDAGPIVRQAPIALPVGLTAGGFDERAGRLGGHLLIQAARALVAGTAQPIAQDEAAASYDPAPTADDYLVPLDGPARAAYRFVAGVAGDGGPLAVPVDGRRVPIQAAVSHRTTGDLGLPWQWRAGVLWLQCHPGLLVVRPVEGHSLRRLDTPAAQPVADR
ncbi:MAG: hypothetical protein IT340_02825 [Chloroflexi bacterium]|nr:hypothetical protein [Chloroflexota bacterium]